MQEKIKILVVDDNEPFAVNLKDILEVKGYEVQTATDGFKGLELFKKIKFSLVIMDIKMPVMNGVETFKKMKEIDPGVPVIMVTAYALENLIKESLVNGAFGCLYKPLNFDKLFEIINNSFKKGSLILVIDDDKNLCHNLKDILVRKGYTVKTANDSDTAIQNAVENNFDIMLLDMKLPPLNGLETYLAIKAYRPNVTVIIITGFLDGMSEDIAKARMSNAYACIEKPVNMDDLIKLLERIKEQRESGGLVKPE